MRQAAAKIIRCGGLAGIFAIWAFAIWVLVVFAWLERTWDQPGATINSFQASSIEWGRIAGWWIRDYNGLLWIAFLVLIAVTGACLQNAISSRRRVA